MSFSVPKSEYPKFAAAYQAVQYVADGMKLGLGTGSTAYWFVILLAHRIKSEGINVTCVATSKRTFDLAASHDVPLTTLDQMLEPDMVVDGADEISPKFDLIKGGGGALLQEKIVANAGDRLIIIADEGKFVEKLGAFHLPVEVVKFGWKSTMENIRELLEDSKVANTEAKLRRAEMDPFITDEGHYIIDCFCDVIENPELLSSRLNQIPGVVENGLFIGRADTIILGRDDGMVRTIDRETGDSGYEKIPLPIDLEFTE